MPVKLTKTVIAEAEVKAKEYVLWDSEVRKFGVRISPSGRKMFVFQYRVGRQSRKLTIGPAEVLSVTCARDQARAYTVDISRGIDPHAIREAKRNAITVNELAKQFDASHITFHVKDSTGRKYRYALKKYILPALG